MGQSSLIMAGEHNWMSDTSPEAFAKLVELQRDMPWDRKWLLSIEASEMLIRLAEEDVRRQFPEASDREVFLPAAARRLGRDLMIRAYGWDPGEERPFATEYRGCSKRSIGPRLGGFNGNSGQIREALRLGRAFNIIHLRSASKFGSFARSNDDCSQSQFGRRPSVPADLGTTAWLS